MAIHHDYPTYRLAGTPWMGMTIHHQPKCKCCADDVQAELLELLVIRASGKKVERGVRLTLDGLVAYLFETSRAVSRQSLILHMKKHIEISKLPPAPAKGPKTGHGVAAAPAKGLTSKAAAERERKVLGLRKAVAEDVDMEPSEDSVTRGPHVVYLEKVVRIASHVVDHFPEKVTLEMGIRASAEIAKLRVNDSREALIDMLVASGSVSPARHGQVGFPQVVRELDTGHETPTEEVADAELVADG